MQKLPYDYIRGLVEGEGTFTFSTRQKILPDGSIKRVKVPAFAIKMHERDEYLLHAVKYTLGLKNKIYNYDHAKKGGYHRGRQVMLIVREHGALKGTIIPFFYKKLHGNKGKQFVEWIEKMGEENTSEFAKHLHRIYKVGYFEELSKNFE